MFRLKSTRFYLLIIATVLFISCGDDDGISIPVGTDGFFVVNEGGFGNGNTSISFYDRETETVSNEVFANVNGALGDQAQSMALFNGLGYIVVQNSDKIEIINTDTFESVGTIDEELPSPRYFVGLSSQKGYVSDWGADGVTGTVKVIDLRTNEVTKTISTGQGTNRMLLLNNQLWVTNSGGFGRDNTIKVINTSTDEVSQTVELSDNPNSLQVDINGNIWVATSGHTAFDPETFEVIVDESTAAALIQLSASGEELKRLEYSEVGFSQSAGGLSINNAGDQLYYLFGSQIYELSIEATSLPDEPFSDKFYYGVAVDPIDETVIGFEAPNFSSSGNMDFYSPQGELMSTFAVGIGPNGATFK